MPIDTQCYVLVTILTGMEIKIAKEHDAISELLLITLEGWKPIHGTKFLPGSGGNGEVTDE